MVSGGLRTPLSPMHLSPTSRMSSAAQTALFGSPFACEEGAVANPYSSSIERGEFIVMVAAVYRFVSCKPQDRQSNGRSHSEQEGFLTEAVSQAGKPTERA